MVSGNTITSQDVTISVTEEEQEKRNFLQKLGNFLFGGRKNQVEGNDAEGGLSYDGYDTDQHHYMPVNRVINIEENLRTETNRNTHLDNSVVLNTDAKHVKHGDVGNNAVIWLI